MFVCVCVCACVSVCTLFSFMTSIGIGLECHIGSDNTHSIMPNECKDDYSQYPRDKIRTLGL